MDSEKYQSKIFVGKPSAPVKQKTNLKSGDQPQGPVVNPEKIVPDYRKKTSTLKPSTGLKNIQKQELPGDFSLTVRQTAPDFVHTYQRSVAERRPSFASSGQSSALEKPSTASKRDSLLSYKTTTAWRFKSSIATGRDSLLANKILTAQKKLSLASRRDSLLSNKTTTDPKTFGKERSQKGLPIPQTSLFAQSFKPFSVRASVTPAPIQKRKVEKRPVIYPIDKNVVKKKISFRTPIPNRNLPAKEYLPFLLGKRRFNDKQTGVPLCSQTKNLELKKKDKSSTPCDPPSKTKEDSEKTLVTCDFPNSAKKSAQALTEYEKVEEMLCNFKDLDLTDKPSAGAELLPQVHAVAEEIEKREFNN